MQEPHDTECSKCINAKRVKPKKKKQNIYKRGQTTLLVDEYAFHILDDELHREVLGMHVRHLPVETAVAHDGGREHNR